MCCSCSPQGLVINNPLPGSGTILEFSCNSRTSRNSNVCCWYILRSGNWVDVRDIIWSLSSAQGVNAHAGSYLGSLWIYDPVCTTFPLMFKVMQQQHSHSTTFQHFPSFVGTVHETTVMIWSDARALGACPPKCHLGHNPGRNSECRVESELKSELEIPKYDEQAESQVSTACSDKGNPFEETGPRRRFLCHCF